MFHPSLFAAGLSLTPGPPTCRMQAPRTSAASFPAAGLCTALTLGRPSACTDTLWLLWPRGPDQGQWARGPGAHLSWCMASQVLGATLRVHRSIEALELPDTAAPPVSLPCPGAASFTLPCSCPSIASWNWKVRPHSSAGARAQLRPCLPAAACPAWWRGLWKAPALWRQSPGARAGTGWPTPCPPMTWTQYQSGTWLRRIGFQDVPDG